jgi:hypothetical protein
LKRTFMNLISVLVIMAGCARGFDTVFAPRGSQQCPPLIVRNERIVYGEYELKKNWSGWDIWIGDEEKNEELFDLHLKCFIQNKSEVPVRIFGYPRKRKWLQPNETFEWYTGVMDALISGQGVGRKHFNIWTDQDVKTIKFSIGLEFESKLCQPYVEIPVTATYSDNI